MIALLSLLATFSIAVSTLIPGGPIATGLVGPIYSQHVATPKGDYHYTSTDLEGAHGAVQQQTAVGKDVHGGHSIRHSAQATRHNPLSGETAVKHDDHAFHINPYYGQAAVHTNTAEGSLNPLLGQAAFQQKTHEAQIAPGHTSVVEKADTAAVSPHVNAASKDVHAARTDVVHDGVAHSAHTAHRSYAQGPHIGGVSKTAATTQKRFDGHGYGNLRYNTHSANQAYDPYGHASVNEAGYDLNQAYDARVGLGASNELEYSRHAAQDPYGNYGAVTQSKQSSHGGHLVPQHATVYQEPVVYESSYVPTKAVAYQQPVVYESSYVPKETVVAYQEPVVYESSYVPTKTVAYQAPAAYVTNHNEAYGAPAYYYHA